MPESSFKINIMAKRDKRVKKFLLLDKDDITKVCGSLTVKELSKKLKRSHGSLNAWLNSDGILDGKYYVVEDI